MNEMYNSEAVKRAISHIKGCPHHIGLFSQGLSEDCKNCQECWLQALKTDPPNTTLTVIESPS